MMKKVAQSVSPTLFNQFPAIPSFGEYYSSSSVTGPDNPPPPHNLLPNFIQTTPDTVLRSIHTEGNARQIDVRMFIVLFVFKGESLFAFTHFE